MIDSGSPGAGNPGSPELAARMERLRSRKVFIATPIARHPVRQYTLSLATTQVLLAQLGIKFWYRVVVGNSNLCRARNELVAAFLATGYDDLVFIDDDMGWQPEDFCRLIASEREIVGGVGCKKILLPDINESKWCLRVLERELTQDDMGAIEVAGLGTGFLKISRPVFEKWITHHPDRKLLPPARIRGTEDGAKLAAWYYRFFEFPVDETGEEYGEDIAFCLEYRRLGGTVWMDPAIKLLHVGEHEFSGDITALLQPQEERGLEL